MKVESVIFFINPNASLTALPSQLVCKRDCTNKHLPHLDEFVGTYCIRRTGPQRVDAAELNQTNRAINAVLAKIVHTKIPQSGNSIGNFIYCVIVA